MDLASSLRVNVGVGQGSRREVPAEQHHAWGASGHDAGRRRDATSSPKPLSISTVPVASIGMTATGPVDGNSLLPSRASDALSTWAPSAARWIDPSTAAAALRASTVVAALAGTVEATVTGTVEVTADADVVAALDALAEVGDDGRVVATVEAAVDALVEVGDDGRVVATVDVAAVDGNVVVHATAGVISSAMPAMAQPRPAPICSTRRPFAELVLLVTEMFIFDLHIDLG